ncbi:MAG: hypothetical protein KDK06_00535 [Gammaproteobacteria bacterium]|nr:hypothetical protein [Planctomycetota bacterium]MCB1745627.1 hypothetical protein [Gammaproteobacteria bacterium]
MSTLRIVLLACALAGAGQVAAAELGRLFLTPGERDALDQARYAAPMPGDTAANAAAADEVVIELSPGQPAVELPVPPVEVDGYVKRSDGPATVWINGTDANEGNLADFGIDARDVRVERDRVRVPIGREDSVTLKPGQTFDPGSARISDAYEKPPVAVAEP